MDELRLGPPCPLSPINSPTRSGATNRWVSANGGLPFSTVERKQLSRENRSMYVREVTCREIAAAIPLRNSAQTVRSTPRLSISSSRGVALTSAQGRARIVPARMGARDLLTSTPRRSASSGHRSDSKVDRERKQILRLARHAHSNSRLV